MTRETLQQRIARERHEMNLMPWQFAPSEIGDGPSPYPPGTAGHESWRQAQEWRAEIRKKNPHYFDAD
jgi:hypothetical protein